MVECSGTVWKWNASRTVNLQDGIVTALVTGVMEWELFTEAGQINQMS